MSALFDLPAEPNPWPNPDDFAQLRPVGGFKVIYADPPWEIVMRAPSGERKAPQAHYECWPTKTIGKLPVYRIAATDAWCFMWATFPMLADALELMALWGFTYTTGAAWAKESKNSGPLDTEDDEHCFAFGTGYIFRSAAELLLVGKRGEPRLINSRDARSVRNLIYAPVREHSRKPNTDVRHMIETLCPGPYIELFARSESERWAAWGNQVSALED